MRLEAVLAVFKWFTGAAEIRTPECTVLPDGRKRLVRYFAIADAGTPPPCMAWAFGSLDATTCPTGWENLRLVGKKVDEMPRGRDNRPVAILTYETLNATTETAVGDWTQVRLEDGRTAWEKQWLILATATYAPATVGASYTVPTGTAYLQKEEAANDGLLRRITRTCITAGTLSTRLQTKAGGKILVQTITAAVTAPSTPSGYTLIDQPVQNPSGLPIYTYTFIKGSGVIDKETRELGDGLLRVTWTSLGTKEVPPGIEMNDSTESEEDGYKRYRTVCIQHLDGLTPVGKTFTYQTMIPWTYPGRAHPYATTVDGSPRVLINVFYSPPVETEVVGTVNVTYSTTATMSAPGNLWQPTDWATVYAKFLGSGGHPTAKVETIRGYRKTGTTNVEVTGAGTSGVDDPGGTCLGYNVYGNSTASIVVAGGPANPDGQTYTLRFEHRPDFVAADGTQYFKTTAITATIPTQPALPSSF